MGGRSSVHPKKIIRLSLTGIKMSVSVSEGGQDDDILGLLFIMNR
jgi:hypothetical protein